MKNQPKQKIHFAPGYFSNPVHRLSVDVIGAGGNGSQMISALARIDHALRKLDRQGLHVTLWDDDIVEETNIGRQLFSGCDLGLNKAEVLISRFNRIYGLDWHAEPRRFDIQSTHGLWNMSNIYITCVDNIDVRKNLGEKLKKKKNFSSNKGYHELNEYDWMYWLDLGNAQTTGQAILGSNWIQQPAKTKFDCIEHLPLITEMHKFTKRDDRDSGPSCSLAESLRKQDLFINSTLVQFGASLLWNLILKGYIQTRGCYLDIASLTCLPIEL